KKRRANRAGVPCEFPFPVRGHSQNEIPLSLHSPDPPEPKFSKHPPCTRSMNRPPPINPTSQTAPSSPP
uniref:Uncharacterized protein n=1 Tax=Aegilops tauschii subsp. strangulata TaxID=200361 RepID=A0A452XY28_AEGTS